MTKRNSNSFSRFITIIVIAIVDPWVTASFSRISPRPNLRFPYFRAASPLVQGCNRACSHVAFSGVPKWNRQWLGGATPTAAPTCSASIKPSLDPRLRRRPLQRLPPPPAGGGSTLGKKPQAPLKPEAVEQSESCASQHVIVGGASSCLLGDLQCQDYRHSSSIISAMARWLVEPTRAYFSALSIIGPQGASLSR